MNEFERVASPAVEPRRPSPAQAPMVSRVAEGAPMTTDSILHLQRTAGNASVAGMLSEGSGGSPVQDFLAGSSGQALDGPMRSTMEGALGADLSGVRVHQGGDASSSAASVQARAYTVGSDVVLGNDVNPANHEGQKTLAHELTHVVQQQSGPVDGTPAEGGIRLSDPSDRFERAAEATASSIMSGGPALSSGGGSSAAGATAQREGVAAPKSDEEQDDPTAQGEFLQRAAGPAEEETEEEQPAPA